METSEQFSDCLGTAKYTDAMYFLSREVHLIHHPYIPQIGSVRTMCQAP